MGRSLPVAGPEPWSLMIQSSGPARPNGGTNVQQELSIHTGARRLFPHRFHTCNGGDDVGGDACDRAEDDHDGASDNVTTHTHRFCIFISFSGLRTVVR